MQNSVSVECISDDKQEVYYSGFNSAVLMTVTSVKVWNCVRYLQVLDMNISLLKCWWQWIC